MENLHAGHRQRLKKQFMEHGIESLREHQILELLLFYVLPRVDTNEYAHSLIKKYGSVSAVLNAPFDELKFEKGVGENGAVLLKLIPHIYTVYASQMNSAQPMNTARIVCKYFSTSFLGEKDEIIKVCCLDDNLNIISCQTVLKGNSSSIVVNARRIVEFVLKSNSSLIIIAHNHPNGSELPSDADISATRQLFRILEPLDITLLDHIVVGKNGAVSMKDNSYFDLLD